MVVRETRFVAVRVPVFAFRTQVLLRVVWRRQRPRRDEKLRSVRPPGTLARKSAVEKRILKDDGRRQVEVPVHFKDGACSCMTVTHSGRLYLSGCTAAGVHSEICRGRTIASPPVSRAPKCLMTAHTWCTSFRPVARTDFLTLHTFVTVSSFDYQIANKCYVCAMLYSLQLRKSYVVQGSRKQKQG